jgi:hypothetical protein
MAKEPEKFERKKVRKKRKPMSEEQRKQAVERLAKARAARQAANPSQPKNVCEEVLNLPDEHFLSYNKVREWIKTNQELLKEARAEERRGTKGAHAEVKSLEAYIRNMNKYLRDGDWVDNFYGSDQGNKIKWRCVHPAYDDDGNIKRSHGVFYMDLGYRWGYEPEDDDYYEEEDCA